MPTDRPMRPMPRDGSMFRVKLLTGELAVVHFLESTSCWICFRPGGLSFISEVQLGTVVKSWAPMGYGGWSPYWDGLTELLDADPGVEEIANERWFIWQKMGHSPRFAWGTEREANDEAKRLAALFPGNSFIVMHSQWKFRVEAPVMGPADGA